MSERCRCLSKMLARKAIDTSYESIVNIGRAV